MLLRRISRQVGNNIENSWRHQTRDNTLHDISIFTAFHCGFPIAQPRLCKGSMPCTFTKFLKRYLQIPSHSSNATVHFITSTVPLSKTLHKASPNAIASLSFPPILHGHCLSFFPKPVEEEPSKDFIEIVKDIPTSFWLSRMPLTIPSNCKARKRLLREIFDSDHFRICKTTTFHTSPALTCVCLNCDENAHPYHARYCNIDSWLM